MKSAYIIDDEMHVADYLKQKILSVTGYFDEIHIFNDAQSAFEAILTNKPDLIFSDIEMPHMTGISLHEKISHLKIPLIFVTSHVQFSIIAIKQQAFDYLLKPVKEDELRDCIQRYLEYERQQSDLPVHLSLSEISIRQKGKMLLHALEKIYIIALEDIISLKADNSYTIFQMIDGNTITASKPIRFFEDELTASGFLRVHRSNIINIQYIKEIKTKDGDTVLLANGKSVNASKEGKALILEYFKKL